MIKKLLLISISNNSIPHPQPFVSLPLQSRSYYKVRTIYLAISLVNEDKNKPSLEDRVDCYMNGILNYYFKWEDDRPDKHGKKVDVGCIIAPQCWTHQFDKDRRKPDFTVTYTDEKGAKDPFGFLWVENKRPHESFFKALDQVCADLYK